MSKSPATRAVARRERPLSPHLTVYRPPITMTMSIIHRATGIANSAGMALLALWLVAAAMDQEALNLAFELERVGRQLRDRSQTPSSAPLRR